MINNLHDFTTAFDDFNDASILITGGTGSLGQEFIAHVLDNYSPRRLIVYSRDELKQYEMQQRFSRERYPAMRYFLGDMRDQARLEMAMEGVDFVMHAAALKHVTLTEYNPFECVLTNIMGAQNLVLAALKSNVKKVVALSTDKAAAPINLYGATKLASDKIFIAANNMAKRDDCTFSIVRYGNVLNSRGSVIPYFNRLLSEGTDHLPITDARMTRFVITLNQGVDLITKAFSLMNGGEIFVPKIPSMRIVDLASAMAPDLEQRVVGIRPGEKIHEILIPREDARRSVDAGNFFIIKPEFPYGEYVLPTSIPDNNLEEDFEYDSNINDWFLTTDEINTQIEHLNLTS